MFKKLKQISKFNPRNKKWIYINHILTKALFSGIIEYSDVTNDKPMD